MELFDQSGTVAQLETMVTTLAARQDVESVLVFAADANGFTPAEVDPIMHRVGVTVFGGVFPQVIFGGINYSRGTVAVGLKQRPQVLVLPGLSNPDADYEATIDELIEFLPPTKTMYVWVDGLSSRISALIESIFNVFGLAQNYIGGGAGSLSFEQRPCLFTNDGMVEDSAILALMNTESGIGVSHGWKSVNGPFKVTNAESNIIRTLDWEPAFEVYRRVVNNAFGTLVNHDNFFELAKGYPFGISRLGAEYVVRDPIVVDDHGALTCVGEVPVESYVDILSGSVGSLVDAASKARQLAEEAYNGDLSDHLVVFIDCISRVLFLQEEFVQELNAVHRPGDRMVGALTLGEIANSGREYLEFYNKTSVVGIFEA